MGAQADRAAEQRKAKLEEMQRQINTGSLKVRKMTAKERGLYPPKPAKKRRG